VKKSPLRKISKKQRARNEEWRRVCVQKIQEQKRTRGFIYCEICMLPERPQIPMYVVWGHHKDRNRRNNTIENCELAHWICHQNKYHGGMSYG
jgi:hypothetical protein